MKISVNAPSYKRPIVDTLRYLPFCKIWVDESEAEFYVAQNKNFKDNIIVCDKGIQGNLCRVRNHILDREFEAGADVVLIVDDDLQRFGIWQGTPEHYEKRWLKTDDVMPFVEKYSNLCDEFGFKMWGMNCNSNTMSYMQYNPFSTRAYLGGPFQCFLKNPLRYDENLPLKEDYDMTIQQCNKYRGVLRVNFAFYQCKQSVQKGGCATYRNIEREMEQLALLQKKWGSRIVKYDNARLGNVKNKRQDADYNPVIHIPIAGV